MNTINIYTNWNELKQIICSQAYKFVKLQNSQGKDVLKFNPRGKLEAQISLIETKLTSPHLPADTYKILAGQSNFKKDHHDCFYFSKEPTEKEASGSIQTIITPNLSEAMDPNKALELVKESTVAITENKFLHDKINDLQEENKQLLIELSELREAKTLNEKPHWSTAIIEQLAPTLGQVFDTIQTNQEIQLAKLGALPESDADHEDPMDPRISIFVQLDDHTKQQILKHHGLIETQTDGNNGSQSHAG